MERKHNSTLLLLAATAGVASFVTYVLTKRSVERQEIEERKIEYMRTKVAEDPSGLLLKDHSIQKVYLWDIENLGKVFKSTKTKNRTFKFIGNSEGVMGSIKGDSATTYLRAGPRELLHFDPQKVSAAIVTCGGLCPGLNNVIREITHTLLSVYKIGGKVYGIQGGFAGFANEKYTDLTLTHVENIHHEGGTILGSSRGGFDLDKILNFLRKYNISQLYIIGGDGTHRGAFKIHEGCLERNMNVTVAGIPKTIDNDVEFLDYSFGFRSAVAAAVLAIRSAKTEATCNLPNGIGIVKLMGRSAGFIAAHAVLASADVDLCLIPEVPIVLDDVLPHLQKKVEQKGFGVVVVAEGAGEELLGKSSETDASGNKILPKIGDFMKRSVIEYFEGKGKTTTVKYIDPSYMIRSVPANAGDSLYCMQLAQNAVHGSMAGYTGFSVGLSNNRMVYLPIPKLVESSPRSMNPHGRTWERVISVTGQPDHSSLSTVKHVSHSPIFK